jgi:hypothetical protein
VNKPIIVNNITFSDRFGQMILKEEYNITFKSSGDVEKFIQSRYEYWKELLGKDMTIAHHQNETLEDVEIQKLFKTTASVMGLAQSHIFRRTRITEIVEARRHAIAICTDLGKTVTTIARAIGFNHATIGHHRDKFFDLCDIDKGYEASYLKIKDSVLTELNGEYSEDGSGEKIKKNEKSTSTKKEA